jgi:crotonobetainyl-CoA:carnitine CoA-transferase CaiB-like acyl-CoA transferase
MAGNTPLPDLDEPALGGLRVVDLGALLPGPVCALHLAWMGADVIKIEPPTGEPGRHLYDGAFFDTYNRGKRSVALDLKSETGRSAAFELCRTADVVIENFRPGVADRLGLGVEQLTAANPGLIYCSISGYGHGSRAAAPAHDLNFLAKSGALGQATTWSAQGRQPTRPAMPIGDFGGAAMAVQGILAALYKRTRTGRGARIHIVMSEVLVHWMAWRTAAEDRPDGDAWTQYLEPANDMYETAEGRFIVIGAIENHLWRAFADVAAHEGADLGFDPDMADWDWRERRVQAPGLAEKLRALFKRHPLDWWASRLQAAGVPADPVATPSEAFADPWLQEQGLVQADGWVRPPLPGVSSLAPAPVLDADGDAVRDGRFWRT